MQMFCPVASGEAPALSTMAAASALCKSRGPLHPGERVAFEQAGPVSSYAEVLGDSPPAGSSHARAQRWIEVKPLDAIGQANRIPALYQKSRLSIHDRLQNSPGT